MIKHLCIVLRINNKTAKEVTMKKIILTVAITLLLMSFLLFYLKTFTGILGAPKFIHMHSYVSSILEPEKYRNGFVRPENIEKINISESNLKEAKSKLKYCDNIKNIDILYPENKTLDDLSFLENQYNVKHLYISGKCSDWSGISSCKDTTVLSIMKSNFINIEMLKEFRDLHELTIETDSYVDYQGFDMLDSLESFYILGPNVDISQIVKADSLYYLHIRYNKVLTDYDDFPKSTSIKNLTFSDSVINKEYLESIVQMTGLENLKFYTCEFNMSESEAIKLISKLSDSGTEINITDITDNTFKPE